MKNKIILLFLIIFVLVSLGAVSATDNVDDIISADSDASDIYVSGGGEMTPMQEQRPALLQQ